MSSRAAIAKREAIPNDPARTANVYPRAAGGAAFGGAEADLPAKTHFHGHLWPNPKHGGQ